MFFLWVQIVVMFFFMVLGTIGKSLRFFWVLDMIFFMALDMFFLDLDMFFFYDFFMGLEMVLAKIVKKSILGTLVAFTFFFNVFFFFDFGTVPYENRKKIVNKS